MGNVMIWLKEKIKRAGEMFHKAGFWVMVLVLIGAILGGAGMQYYQKQQMDNAILLGGLVYDKKVYDIKIRIQ
jgi:predicted negative regulator of RcsB-dependent stress response